MVTYVGMYYISFRDEPRLDLYTLEPFLWTEYWGFSGWLKTSDENVIGEGCVVEADLRLQFFGVGPRVWSKIYHSFNQFSTFHYLAKKKKVN